MRTSILTCAEWLDLACPLATPNDALRLVSTARDDDDINLDARAARSAVNRLAEIHALNTRLIDSPLYRLLGADVRPGRVGGDLGVSSFVHYALTMDLLENELLDTLAADADHLPGTLPLRDLYLPNADAVVDVAGRLCVGGALALCAVARPRGLHGEADYVLLVQQRSEHVINAGRQLAVIPKGFHQPMTDYRADTRLSVTLTREMEEELFGREDIDSTLDEPRTADPLHLSLLTEPMTWLMAEPDRLRLECTGFGLNLVSGNYECASLIVIDDEEFWGRHGGQITANWESTALRRYSTRDRELITELIGDEAWNNEALFALLQGLRRLAEIGGSRVDLPDIEWEL